jgi:hypothetical protein
MTGTLITGTIRDNLLAGVYDSERAKRVLRAYEDSSTSEEEAKNVPSRLSAYGDSSGIERPSLPTGQSSPALSGQPTCLQPSPVSLPTGQSSPALSGQPSALSGQPTCLQGPRDNLLAGFYDSAITKRLLKDYESTSEEESKNVPSRLSAYGDSSGIEGPSLPAVQSSPALSGQPMLLSRSLALSGQPSFAMVRLGSCLHRNRMYRRAR